MDSKKVMGTIRQLREHMGLSQSDFAREVVDKTIATQQRYESIRPPDGKLLALLARVARTHGRGDLSAILREAAIDTVDPEIRQLIDEPAPGLRPVVKRAGK